MQKTLWKTYESDWQYFKFTDHMKTLAPIPPNCRILTLHIYLLFSK